jgi:hypothetical protein
MRRLWIVVAALLAFGGLAMAAPGAGAAVPSASNAKFCADAKKLGNSSSDLSDTASLKTRAKAVANEFKSAAKNATPKVKKAMLTISKFVGSLGSLNAADLARVYTGKGFKNYTNAISVWVQAVSACDTTSS